MVTILRGTSKGGEAWKDEVFSSFYDMMSLDGKDVDEHD
jgi:hypothetical protein